MSKQKRTGTIPRMKVAVDVDFIQSDSRTIRASKTITRTDIPNLSGMRIEHVDIGAKEVPCCSLCGKHLSRYGMCRDCKETRNVQELEKRRALLQDEVSNYVRDGSHRYVKGFDHNIEKGCCQSHAELLRVTAHVVWRYLVDYKIVRCANARINIKRNTEQIRVQVFLFIQTT